MKLIKCTQTNDGLIHFEPDDAEDQALLDEWETLKKCMLTGDRLRGNMHEVHVYDQMNALREKIMKRLTP